VCKFRSLLTAAMVAASPAAFAIDGVSFEGGRSNSSYTNVDLYRVGVLWDWNKKLVDFGGWHIGGFWDVSLGYWDNSSPVQTGGYSISGLQEIGVTPTFRLQQNTIAGFSPYAEIAIGFHLLSETSVSAQRQFGSSFQFSDHIGAGFRFGDKGRYDIGYRYQHLSNAGLKEPNDGINFHILRLQYRF
jgi:lipid A 3-O-deacylase